MIGGMAVNNVFKKLEALGQKTNCIISLDFYCIGKSHRNVQIDDCETKEHCSVDVNWEWSEYEILKTILVLQKESNMPECCLDTCDKKCLGCTPSLCAYEGTTKML